MKFQLKRQQFLPIGIDNAWSFFSSPLNLSLITPNDLGLVLKSKVNPSMQVNDEIDYVVRPILGIPLIWKTKISLVEQPYQFVDKQLKGPYQFWEHLHEFKEVEGGVLMKDTVNYIIPFGWLGSLFSFYVKRKLNSIFDFRKEALDKLLLDGSIN
jgi:ligand-binding SRPBCC domain-containing protein